jgi:hypothetical protein
MVAVEYKTNLMEILVSLYIDLETPGKLKKRTNIFSQALSKTKMVQKNTKSGANIQTKYFYKIWQLEIKKLYFKLLNF